MYAQEPDREASSIEKLAVSMAPDQSKREATAWLDRPENVCGIAMENAVRWVSSEANSLDDLRSDPRTDGRANRGHVRGCVAVTKSAPVLHRH